MVWVTVHRLIFYNCNALALFAQEVIRVYYIYITAISKMVGEYLVELYFFLWLSAITLPKELIAWEIVV
ncbi:hypothetical protein D3C80_1726200 [compost metagenome]